MIAMIDPPGSWVAKWQRIVNYQPGMYAIEVVGQLPDDAIEYCEEMGFEYKGQATK
jgi:transcription elongation factor SPT4